MNKWKTLAQAFGIMLAAAALGWALSSLLHTRQLSASPMSFDEAERITHETLKDKCASCHDPNAGVPWLTDMVSAGLVKEDMRNAIRLYDMSEPPSEVSLAKLQYATGNGRMPPARYTTVHWGSVLTATEATAIHKWITALRSERFSNHLAAAKFAGEPIQPIPDSLPVNADKAALGYILYHDTRLSDDNTVSCATCHDLNKAGTDNLPVSVGVRDQKGGINAPTVFNSVFHFIQFWDGRAKDLQAQAGGPPLNPVEMGYSDESGWQDIIRKLKADRQLTEQFLKAYPEGYSADTITHAIAEYEKTLITPNSPFDKYLKGDAKAISDEARMGYVHFKQYGCYTCHVGTAMGGQSFEFADLKGDFFGHRPLNENDHGRMNFTKNDTDIHRFRVPNLRNVELTWPYMHDASCRTLEEAVDKMFRYLVGHDTPTKTERARIVEFLRAQTGEYKGKRLRGQPAP